MDDNPLDHFEAPRSSWRERLSTSYWVWLALTIGSFLHLQSTSLFSNLEQAFLWVYSVTSLTLGFALYFLVSFGLLLPWQMLDGLRNAKRSSRLLEYAEASSTPALWGIVSQFFIFCWSVFAFLESVGVSG